MKTLANIAARFREEEEGAALIEYTVLLGIITVAVIATIIAVGGWVGSRWDALCTNTLGNATANGGTAGSCP